MNIKRKNFILNLSIVIGISLIWYIISIFTPLSLFFYEKHLEFKSKISEIRDKKDIITYVKLTQLYKEKGKYGKILNYWLKMYKSDTTNEVNCSELSQIYFYLYERDTTNKENKSKCILFTKKFLRLRRIDNPYYLSSPAYMMEKIGNISLAKEIYQQIYSHFRGDTLLIIDKITKAQVEEKLKELSKNKK